MNSVSGAERPVGAAPTREVQYSAVIGAGTMGVGIAYVLSAAGDEVFLVEPDRDRARRVHPTLERVAAASVAGQRLTETDAELLLKRIEVLSGVDALPAQGADLVVEAVPEQADLKAAVLRAVEDRCAPRILASNTSSLSVSSLAARLSAPDRMLGLHFFNPVWAMPLVEIVVGATTSGTTVEGAVELAGRIGKDSIVVRDAPGFATSRLGVAIGLEAIRMLQEGVASAADIDKAMELGYRHPMGPLRLTDLVGLDVRLAIAQHLERELGPRFAPPQLLVEKVAAGRLGKKAGEGFYDWAE